MNVYVRNFTPHPVQLLNLDGSPRMLFPSDGNARAREHVIETRTIGWDPFGDRGMSDSLIVVRKELGEISGLPEPMEGCMFIVSQIVADACRGKRTDLLVPHDMVRDAHGNIIGCRGFSVPA